MNSGSLLFIVQGSEELPYQVTVKKESNNLTVNCTCQGAVHGLVCKHRMAIVTGNISDIEIIDFDPDLINIVGNWLKGSDVEQAILKFKILEKEINFEIKKIKNILNDAKKNIHKSMID